MPKKLLNSLPALLSLMLFCVALWILHHTLADVRLGDIANKFRALPPSATALAVVLTAASYSLLIANDALALRHIGQRVPYPKVALASFVGYVFSHNIGLSLLTSGSIRYRIYSGVGLSAFEIGSVTLLCGLTFTLGATTVAGIALLAEPADVLSLLRFPPAIARIAGALCLTAVIGYVVWAATRKTPIRFRGASVQHPPAWLSLTQIALSVADIALAAGALYSLSLGALNVSFPLFLGIFVLAIAAGVISHVPGGLGVFETLIVVMLPQASPDALLASLLAYRCIYYLLPLALAVLLMGGYELARHKHRFVRLTAAVSDLISTLLPQVLGVAVLVGGAALLLSGASPTLDARLHYLRKIVPLPVVEVSHLLASLSGLGLLILARGLFRRLDSAYHLTVILLVCGVIFSLLKGFDYEEAFLLGFILAVLLSSHEAFYRKASMWKQRFTPGWMLTVAVIVAGSIWLGLFSYKHIEYSRELWWQFAFHGDAPRFLRASFAVVVLAVGFGLYRLLQGAPPVLDLPTAHELERARVVISRSSASEANLALLGDKKLLFSDSGDAFIMFGVEGRSWVALGDPVGPAEAWADLAWKFRELCDLYNGRPVLYQITPAFLPIAIDFGLSPIKLGEEARVPLASFSLQGKHRQDLRYAQKRAAREGAHFELIQPQDVRALLPELKAVSDSWLAERKAQEKGFSVGFFDPEYLARFPCAVVRAKDRIVAFANVWTSGDKHDLAVDLMRHQTDSPYGVMDFLFAELMLWGRGQGYRWFNLGMAPLSGLEEHALAPFWHRAGTFVFRHGEHFYNFEGLRRYKEKFQPEWRPRYLATLGGIALAQAVLDVAQLISGGFKGMFAK